MSGSRRDRASSLADRAFRSLGILVRSILGPPARAARGTARRVADPARQVVDYWGSERRTMRQGVVAVLIAAMTSLIAGVTLAGMEGRIDAVTGLFVLIPVSIGMRGAIFGALAARLGTSIHTGLFEVSAERSGMLFQNVYAATLLTVATSVTMGILGTSIAHLLGVETVSVWDFIVVALVGGVLSSAIVLAVTVKLSITSHRRGWDLDAVGAPLITAIGDVVTLPFLALASFLVGIEYFTVIAGALGLAAGIVSLARGWTTVRPVTRRIVREAFPVLCIAIVLDILAGTVVEPRFETVFKPFPAFLIIIPGFLENTGALGSILAARLGSKLHLGAVTPRARPDAAALLDGSIVLALGVTVYTMTAVTTLAVSMVFGFAYPSVASFVAVVLLGGLLATLVAALIGYYAATVTYRFGFDPDNHTIPLVTSGMDLLGVICLVLALWVVGVA
ncbi:MAG TPA: magnesium transporter [Actinomycetota bacterium]|jgi:mgtE-like transporter|nr:magnesium transporter [Actinomycetota bacterium]